MIDQAATVMLGTALYYLDAGEPESSVRPLVVADWRHLGSPQGAFMEARDLATASVDPAARSARKIFDGLVQQYE